MSNVRAGMICPKCREEVIDYAERKGKTYHIVEIPNLSGMKFYKEELCGAEE